jgi:hypothetical protein
MNKLIKSNNFPFPNIKDIYNNQAKSKFFSQIKCSKSKSKMVITEIEFSGNTISEHKIYPNRNRAKCIRQKPRPETLKELQAWLGAANYLRKYIVNYAEIVQPFYYVMDL